MDNFKVDINVFHWNIISIHKIFALKLNNNKRKHTKKRRQDEIEN